MKAIFYVNGMCSILFMAWNVRGEKLHSYRLENEAQDTTLVRLNLGSSGTCSIDGRFAVVLGQVDSTYLQVKTNMIT